MIKGIIFDGGNTLFRFPANSQEISHRGATEMAAWYLKKKHIKLDADALIEVFLAEREAGYERAKATMAEVLATECLKNALEKIDAPPTASLHIEAAIKIFFGPAETVWEACPDAADTLKQLKAQQYRLGFYSNATDDALVQRLVNKNGLRPWLSPTFSSAGCGWRKPKQEAFNLIAERWNLPATEIVMVGDTLIADILGAQNAGMRSILVTMDENPSNNDNRHIQPDAEAPALSSLSGIIAGL